MQGDIAAMTVADDDDLGVWIPTHHVAEVRAQVGPGSGSRFARVAAGPAE
jgi:hypothetical protein